MANAKKKMIEIEDTETTREMLQDNADRSLYEEVSGLFWSAVFGKLVDYGEIPDQNDMETALALVADPDEFVRPFTQRAEEEPGAANMPGYQTDDRQVLSENQYESLIENGNRVLKAIHVGEVLQGLGFEPQKSPQEVYDEVKANYVTRQQFRKDKEEFTSRKRMEKLAHAREALKSRLAG